MRSSSSGGREHDIVVCIQRLGALVDGRSPLATVKTTVVGAAPYARRQQESSAFPTRRSANGLEWDIWGFFGVVAHI